MREKSVIRYTIRHWLDDTDNPLGEENVLGGYLVSPAAVHEHRRLSCQMTRKVFVRDTIFPVLCFTLN